MLFGLLYGDQQSIKFPGNFPFFKRIFLKKNFLRTNRFAETGNSVLCLNLDTGGILVIELHFPHLFFFFILGISWTGV